MKNNLQITGPEIELIPDLAFIYHHNDSPPMPVEELLKQEGIQIENSLLVGLTVRNWYFPEEKNPMALLEKYKVTIIDIIQFLRERYDATVLFIPHYIGDIPFARQIYARLQDKTKVYLLQGDYSTTELRWLCHSLTILIGTRIHSNILAISAGTPVIPIAYQIHKGFGIMEMAGIDRTDIFNIAQIDIEKLKQRITYLMTPEINAQFRARFRARVSVLQKEIIEKANTYLS